MILVSGYYGYQNSGDEAILAALCNDLESLGINRSQVIVLSGNPSQTEKLHKVRAISRYNLLRIVALMPKARLLISGGGSLLQDSTSWRTIPYYLSMAELAFTFGVPVIMYAQGIGPVQSVHYQRWIKRVVNKMTKASVRDTLSEELLKSWNTTQSNLFVTTDPVFGLPYKRNEPANFIPGITFNLRPYQGWQSDYVNWCHLVKLWIKQYDWPVYFVPLNPEDLKIGKQLLKAVPEMKLMKPKNWLDACNLMSQTKIALTMRLHGMIFASLGGSVPVGLAYDPKIVAIGEQLKIPVRDGKPDENLTIILSELINNVQHEHQYLQKQVEHLEKLALVNRQMLADFLTTTEDKFNG